MYDLLLTFTELMLDQLEVYIVEAQNKVENKVAATICKLVCVLVKDKRLSSSSSSLSISFKSQQLSCTLAWCCLLSSGLQQWQACSRMCSVHQCDSASL